jgi:nitrite reductase/ring-hydroxylating ferredoxin subunit
MTKKHLVAKTQEISRGEHKIVRIGRIEIGLFNIDGNFHAIPNICPHQYGPACDNGAISQGTLLGKRENDFKLAWDYQGEVISCPWHNLQYHIPTGKCLSFPDMNLKPYKLLIEDDLIYVEP